MNEKQIGSPLPQSVLCNGYKHELFTVFQVIMQPAPLNFGLLLCTAQ